jgi:phosphate starvation-inducible PhoH-like protein
MTKRKKAAQGAEDTVLEIQNKYKLSLKQFDLSEKQKQFLKVAFDKDTKMVFVLGPAGSSKTFIATYAALQLFNMDNEYDIFYVRTIAESAERSLGHLPGDMNEKFNPFAMPLEEKLREIIQENRIKMLFEEGIVSCAPINYLRGASWKNKIVLADEAQNFTKKELITLITRIGEDTKYFICGDLMQSDINGKSGLNEIAKLFDDEESKKNGIHVFTFDKADILRSEILKFIISKLEKNK